MKQNFVIFKYLTLLSACLGEGLQRSFIFCQLSFQNRWQKKSRWAFRIFYVGIKMLVLSHQLHLTDWLLCVCSGHCFLSCLSGEWLIPDGKMSDVCNSFYGGTWSRVLSKATSICFACSDRHPFISNVLLELQMLSWDQTMHRCESVLFLKSCLLP